jgi:hypothetical protein
MMRAPYFADTADERFAQTLAESSKAFTGGVANNSY